MIAITPTRSIIPLAAFLTSLALPVSAVADPASPTPASTLTTTAGPNTQPLDIQLPKPRVFGTPKAIKSQHLEKPLAGKRPIYQVPAGTALLSAGKKVTSSDPAPIIGTLDMVTDKDKEAGDGSLVELAPGKQYVQIDLGKPASIAAIVIWHFHQETRVYQDVIVQVADDPDFIMDVTTVFNNDYDNSSGLGAGTDLEYLETHEGKLIDGKGAKGRYVRLYSNGNTSNDANHYVEVEVYGKLLP